ncbi:MAG TPA: dNTP triphosphohydrolase [Caulobacterales bacterium]|nr:dNTP triphosphohydrolase [Caulobacterales bacterium]
MAGGRPLYTDKDSQRRFKLPAENTKSEEGRSEFRRDYGRILHSPSFRRLAGKTQLFPNGESDFFRNRLTHSLEVAQIAKGIATIINAANPYFAENNLNLDIVECAALAHDIGHPPFGHNGEEALNECMNGSGGFEGNAQTLRIVSRLEKREIADMSRRAVSDDGKDERVGLNLTYRTMAALLKYDQRIDETKETSPKVKKGYYAVDTEIVEAIKQHVVGDTKIKKFKTIECCIMDIADDIAYSTYDLEDAMKGGFAHPLSIIASTDDLKQCILDTIKRRAALFYEDCPEKWRDLDIGNVGFVLEGLFGRELSEEIEQLGDGTSKAPALMVAASSFNASSELARNGYIRVKLTSSFVKQFMSGIEVTLNEDCPPLSRVRLDFDTFLRVEVLKNFAYQSLILSSMLKTSEFRGKDIVKRLFEAFDDDHSARLLLPDDHRALLLAITKDSVRSRVVCDYVAGMTDRYAMEVYRRLYSTDPPSMFKPH